MAFTTMSSAGLLSFQERGNKSSKKKNSTVWVTNLLGGRWCPPGAFSRSNFVFLLPNCSIPKQDRHRKANLKCNHLFFPLNVRNKSVFGLQFSDLEHRLNLSKLWLALSLWYDDHFTRTFWYCGCPLYGTLFLASFSSAVVKDLS